MAALWVILDADWLYCLVNEYPKVKKFHHQEVRPSLIKPIMFFFLSQINWNIFIVAIPIMVRATLTSSSQTFPKFVRVMNYQVTAKKTKFFGIWKIAHMNTKIQGWKQFRISGQIGMRKNGYFAQNLGNLFPKTRRVSFIQIIRFKFHENDFFHLRSFLMIFLPDTLRRMILTLVQPIPKTTSEEKKATNRWYYHSAKWWAKISHISMIMVDLVLHILAIAF